MQNFVILAGNIVQAPQCGPAVTPTGRNDC